MKNGKKLTLAERKHVDSIGMQSGDWLIAKKQFDVWTLVHRYTGQAKRVFAPAK